jgi:hypothetical protein
MADFVSLTCPSCGGKLQITNDIDRFSCGFCGNEFLVKRGGGIVTLAPVVTEIRAVKKGVDKTNSELSILRLQNDISELQNRLDKVSPKRKNGIITLISVTPMVLLLFFISKFSQPSGLSTLMNIIVVVLLLSIVVYIFKLRNEEKDIKSEIYRKKEEIKKHLNYIKSI